MQSRVVLPWMLGVIALSLGSCKELEQVTKQTLPVVGQALPVVGQAVPGAGRYINLATTAMDAVLPIDYDDELVIGQAMSLQVVSRYGGVIDAPRLTEYVNLVGQAVATICDRPDIPYYFAILNHSSINAFAAPGGYVFLTRGLLDQIQNEAELAAVLGHEIAHVSRKHILDIIQRSKQLAGATQAGFSYFKQDPSKFKGVVDEAVKKLLDEGLDQGKESEADQVGNTFAARVGYDSSAYVALLTRLRATKGDDPAFFKTHPNFSERIQAVQQMSQEKGWKTNGVLLKERFAKSVKRA